MAVEHPRLVGPALGLLLVCAAGEVRAGAGCAPLAPGADVVPLTATLVLEGEFGEPFVVRLSSAGRPDTVFQRAGMSGGAIDLELSLSELAGFHPRVGALVARESASLGSGGTLSNVSQDGACALDGADAALDLFWEFDVTTSFTETWIPSGPLHVEGRLQTLPPQDATYEVTEASSVDLLDQSTGEFRGRLLYARLELDPTFPPPGDRCFDALVTADLQLFGPGSTTSLIGFGPATLEHALPDPGGRCLQNGLLDCDDDDDCPGSDTCLPANVAVELVRLDAGGFDSLLGAWQLQVAPSGGTSDCCDVHPAPGCTDPLCEAWVCGQDPFCCRANWDELCVGLAQSSTGCVAECFVPGGVPSAGAVESVGPDRTYPASATLGLFVEFDSGQLGAFSNHAPLPVVSPALLTNLPPDPETTLAQTGLPLTLRAGNGQAVGRISNFRQTLQPPHDCLPPPPPGDECLLSQMRIELSLPPCPPESIVLDGISRILRGAPLDPVGLGQESIATLAAKVAFEGSGSCSGPIGLRLQGDGVSAGQVASLAPEEFFPAVSTFQLLPEFDAFPGPLNGGPATLATTVLALPPDPGEIFFGDGTALPLTDDQALPAGSWAPQSHQVTGTTACPGDFFPTLTFPGPGSDAIAVAIPGGGGGVVYDLVRGDLTELVAGQGDFSSAICLGLDGGQAWVDGAAPPPGQGFFYLARDGWGAFQGTWNSQGPGLVGNRDAALTACP